MPSTTFSLAAASAALADLRDRRPLVHNITNYVAMSISANVLLALGLTQLSPTSVALPFKLLLFVAVDGWKLIGRGLVLGYLQ